MASPIWLLSTSPWTPNFAAITSAEVFSRASDRGVTTWFWSRFPKFGVSVWAGLKEKKPLSLWQEGYCSAAWALFSELFFFMGPKRSFENVSRSILGQPPTRLVDPAGVIIRLSKPAPLVVSLAFPPTKAIFRLLWGESDTSIAPLPELGNFRTVSSVGFNPYIPPPTPALAGLFSTTRRIVAVSEA